MASVNVFTAARMQEIEDTTVVGGFVDLDGNLILQKRNEETINAGLIVGPQGPPGSDGVDGVDGVDGNPGGYLLGVAYPWFANSVPSWGLECNGQAISRSTYSGLFALIGTTYGSGNGTTTFNLPDLRGRVPVGLDASQSEFDALNKIGGSKTHRHDFKIALFDTNYGPAGGAGAMMLSTDNPRAGAYRYSTAQYSGAPPVAEATVTALAAGTSAATSKSIGRYGSVGDTDLGSSLAPYRVIKWIICVVTSAADFDTEVQTALVASVNERPLSVNHILNSNFEIWQRGTTVVPTSTQQYCADRWGIHRGAYATGTTVTRQSPADLPVRYSCRVQRDAGNTSTQYFILDQTLETAVSRTLAGRQVTVSFYAKVGSNFSAALGLMQFYLRTGTGTDQAYRSGFTEAVDQIATNVAVSTVWQRFSYTVTLPASLYQVALGFTYVPVGTAGANDWFEITGVQLELGGNATLYRPQFQSLGAELIACQRFFYALDLTVNNQPVGGYGMVWSAGATAYNNITFPTRMRIPPAATFISAAANYRIHQHGIAITGCSSRSMVTAHTDGAEMMYGLSSGSGFLNGGSCLIESTGVSAPFWFNAEL